MDESEDIPNYDVSLRHWRNGLWKNTLSLIFLRDEYAMRKRESVSQLNIEEPTRIVMAVLVAERHSADGIVDTHFIPGDVEVEHRRLKRDIRWSVPAGQTQATSLHQPLGKTDTSLANPQPDFGGKYLAALSLQSTFSTQIDEHR